MGAGSSLHTQVHAPLPRTLAFAPCPSCRVAIVPDRLFCVTCSEDNTVRVWGLPECRLITTLKGHVGVLWRPSWDTPLAEGGAAEAGWGVSLRVSLRVLTNMFTPRRGWRKESVGPQHPPCPPIPFHPQIEARSRTEGLGDLNVTKFRRLFPSDACGAR